MQNTEKKVWVFCNNPGGTRAILSVIKNLNKANIPFTLFANNLAIKMLRTENRKFLTYDSLEKLLAEHPKPDIIITSVCSRLARDLIIQFCDQKEIKSVLVQDYWGAGLKNIWQDPKSHPDYIMVNDLIDVRVIKKCWPKFSSDRIKITGYHVLDLYFNLDTKSLSEKTRADLKITDTNKPIILYAGSVRDYRSFDCISEAQVLQKLIKALNELDQKIYFIPRQHPRLETNTPEEIPA